MFGPRAHPESDGDGRPPGARDVRPPLDVWIDVLRLMRAPSGHRAHTRPGIAVGFRVPGVILQSGGDHLVWVDDRAEGFPVRGLPA